MHAHTYLQSEIDTIQMRFFAYAPDLYTQSHARILTHSHTLSLIFISIAAKINVASYVNSA